MAKEIKRDIHEEYFAATPPLEAKKALFPLAASSLARGRGEVKGGAQKLLFVDVKRAYFYADAIRPVYVQLPDEDASPGTCGRLNKAMNGTRDAASNWERHYREHLESIGFQCGGSTPCVFYHPERLVRLVVHGDDFTFLGNDENLQWCTEQMQLVYDIKIRGKLGPGPNDDKSIRILNRCLEWRRGCLAYEADPRHAEIAIKALGLEGSKPAATPGVKHERLSEEDDPRLDSEQSTMYRRVEARFNFLAQDRIDIQYATKEVMRAMALPRQSDIEKAKRLGRYLLGRPRYVMKFTFQSQVHAVNIFTDSDWAGDKVTTK